MSVFLKDELEARLNHDKTEVMLIHSKYRPSPSFQSLCVGDESVAASQSGGSLGVIFDEHMSFHAHVSSICRSSFYHLRNLSRTRTTTWNLPGPSGTRDCIVYLSHPSPLLCGG